MIQDNRGLIYYVIKFEGQSCIKEINPLNEIHHESVYETKSEGCLGLSTKDGLIYFIDSTKVIKQLQRMKDSRQLQELSDLVIKDKDRKQFVTSDCNKFLICDQQFLIQDCKIFYLHEGDPYSNGILDMEQLSKNQKIMNKKDNSDKNNKEIEEEKLLRFVRGPVYLRDTARFSIVYQESLVMSEEKKQKQQDDHNKKKLPSSYGFESHVYKQIIYNTPDSRQTTLISDPEKAVNFSTFLDYKETKKEGQEEKQHTESLILVKQAKRFFIFSATDGNFIDEVEFDHIIEESEKEKKEKQEKLDKTAQKQKEKETRKDGIDKEAKKEKKDKEAEQNDKQQKEEFEKNKNDPNRMLLQKMSEDTQYFLFKDTCQCKYKIFKIMSTYDVEYEGYHKFRSEEARAAFNSKDSSRKEYEFVGQYVLNLDNKEIFDFFFQDKGYYDRYTKEEKQKKLNQLYEKIDSYEVKKEIIVDDNQITVELIATKGGLENEKKDEQTVHIQVMRCLFQMAVHKKAQNCEPCKDPDIKIYHVNFDSQAEKQVKKQLDQHKEALEFHKKIAQQEIEELPKIYQRDDKRVEQYDKRLDELDFRLKHIYQAHVYNNDLLLVYCGRYIEKGFINQPKSESKQNWFKSKFSKDKEDPNKKNEIATVQSNLRFQEQAEILKMYNTSNKYQIQVVAKNREKGILIIVTWDFLEGKEVSMFQVAYGEGETPENYICRGMNLKKNYFMDTTNVWDLDLNCPIQQAFHNSMAQKGISHQFLDQNKIYKDSTRYLSIDSPQMLIFPQTRKDITFWLNLTKSIDDTKMIQENMSLDMFNIVYEDNSLFHFFADDVDNISVIHQNYKTLVAEGKINSKNTNTPLTLLYPNEDGSSALDIAVEKIRPKSFELMVDILSDFNNIQLSKLMIKVWRKLIYDSNQIILNFFDKALYNPPYLNKPIMVPWPEDCDEFVFAANTSLLKKDYLQTQLMKADKYSDEERKYLEDEKKDKKIKKQKGRKDEENEEKKNKKKGKKEKKGKEKNKDLKGEQAVKQFSRNEGLLRQLDYKVEDDNESKQVKAIRINCQILDLDWIFEGKNLYNLIKMLNNQDNISLYVQQSINILIKFVWEIYEDQIIKWVFYPYVLYMILFVSLGSTIDGGYMSRIHELSDFGMEDTVSTIDFWMFLAILIPLLFLWYYNLRREIMKIKTDSWKNYSADGWNLLDLLSLCLNLFTFSQLIINTIGNAMIFQMYTIRGIFAVQSFVMWIKVFYWMRLYSSTAYYVKLITQTLYDVRLFLYLCLIILFAFANMYYFLNLGTDSNNRVLIHYTGFPIIDSVIAIYMFALGDFHYSDFNKNEYDYLLWGSFVVCTFLMIVVFMNMIIAIMGNTFNNVMAATLENSLNAQFNMVYDHIWLLDLEHDTELFKGQKYIVRAYPDTAALDDQDSDVGGMIENLQLAIHKKQDAIYQDQKKRIVSLEKNQKQLLKSIMSQQLSNKKNIDKIYAKLEEHFKIPEEKKDEKKDEVAQNDDQVIVRVDDQVVDNKVKGVEDKVEELKETLDKLLREKLNETLATIKVEQQKIAGEFRHNEIMISDQSQISPVKSNVTPQQHTERVQVEEQKMSYKKEKEVFSGQEVQSAIVYEDYDEESDFKRSDSVLSSQNLAKSVSKSIKNDQGKKSHKKSLTLNESNYNTIEYPTGQNADFLSPKKSTSIHSTPKNSSQTNTLEMQRRAKSTTKVNEGLTNQNSLSRSAKFSYRFQPVKRNLAKK